MIIPRIGSALGSALTGDNSVSLVVANAHDRFPAGEFG